LILRVRRESHPGSARVPRVGERVSRSRTFNRIYREACDEQHAEKKCRCKDDYNPDSKLMVRMGGNEKRRHENRFANYEQRKEED
jgi:hypothetical protein